MSGILKQLTGCGPGILRSKISSQKVKLLTSPMQSPVVCQTARKESQTATQMSHDQEPGSKVKVTGQKALQKHVLAIPDFEDHKEAYKSKSWPSLIRAFLVFQCCSVDALVDRQLTIINWARKLLGKRLFAAIMKKTLYGHFMGGETREEVMSRVRGHVKYGVLPMIAFTASETHGYSNKSDADFGDLEKFYADCLVQMDTSLQYAQGMKDLSEAVPLVSGKLTCIKPHHIYTSASTLINKNRDYIKNAQESTEGDAETQDFISMVTDCVHYSNNIASLQSALMNMDFHLHVYERGCKDFPRYREMINKTRVDVEGIKSTADAMASLGRRAEECGVVLIWDAEQTYLQTAMDVFILDSMRSYNKDRTVIYGTYQCYLKNAMDKVIRDTGIAEQEGFCWGGKIVRGAYMDEERALATQQAYEDPVNPTYDMTTEMYHKVASHILSLMVEKEVGSMGLIVATHNVDTVKVILNRMAEVNFVPRNNFTFAQLLGMRDNITFCLGQSGVPVGKLVHYGPVEDCVAYLSRRVKENRSGLATANYERHMLRKEIISRIKGR